MFIILPLTPAAPRDGEIGIFSSYLDKKSNFLRVPSPIPLIKQGLSLFF